MSEDARARIRLKDGREVWRDVRVRYREVESGRWVAAEEAEALMDVSLRRGAPQENSPEGHRLLRRRLMEVQSQIALDRDAGAKATSAARLVLNMLRDMEEEDTKSDDRPWFVLGRELAKEVLALIESLDTETG